ncbi:uncharacterized protein At4g15970-like [Cryptomeria japonica]|uniref:uncharacterized protein At4g15970-like n=1 Tax=Cryptomeria japonica TaxID=3369 RepID=UPI0027DAA8CB|nr:uncharacterized protein At4g15970-like [Cryptomeria japonica]
MTSFAENTPSLSVAKAFETGTSSFMPKTTHAILLTIVHTMLEIENAPIVESTPITTPHAFPKAEASSLAKKNPPWPKRKRASKKVIVISIDDESSDDPSPPLKDRKPTQKRKEDELTLALSRASMPNRTVIITTVNAAWMEPGGMFDLFMKSFEIGKGTTPFLKNLLVVAHDEKAFNACIQIHPHCYRLKTPGVDFSGESAYMRGNYVKMTMSKVILLTNVLRRGYHFVFSDSDILWFRNPFQRFSTDADFEMPTDKYLGDPHEIRTWVNTGFMFIRSNNRTVEMMEMWNNASESRPYFNDQDVWNDIKLSESTRVGHKVF